MTNQYLTEKRKKWYMKDFYSLLKVERDFWKIDNSILKEILIEINENPNIQTLYSKYSDKNNPDDKSSYLTFAYTKKVELILFRNVIPHFIDFYNLKSSSNKSICNYDFFAPKENLNFDINSPKFGIKCTDDKNYFRINHIRLNLESYSSQTHKDFWDELKLKFSDLKNG